MSEALTGWPLRLAQSVLATGNTIRRVVQWPILDELLDGQSRGTAADVGAGGGVHSCGMYTFGLLAPRFGRVIALDYSPEYCVILRDKAVHAPNVRVLRASGDELPIPSASVHTLLCAEVLTYLPDDARGLCEIVRVLQPDGRAIISVPLPPEPCPVPGARRAGYTLPQMQTMLATAGLSVEAIRYCMFGLTRLVMRMACPLWRRSDGRWSLPLLWLVYLERWGVRWGQPYDLVVRVHR